jgi:trans-aconitate methyltransferase
MEGFLKMVPSEQPRPRATPESRTAADYNQLPYPSLPVAYTQPAQMAAMLRLFGVDAPVPAQANVLEFGCASAGNIIPLAARFPHARFVGIDLSERHVAEANHRIKTLGLANINVERGDLAEYTVERGSFDYVICHGVFSWVPRHVQDAILRLCGEALSENGVAAVSYNVFPGWHMRRIVRDICLFHAGTHGAPRSRVAKARAALSDIAASLEGATPYATLLRAEAQRLAKAPAAYVLGEFLAENNSPCYFTEFAARAHAAGLGYVCEGDLVSALPEYFFPTVAKQLRETAAGDPIALQQHTDFFSGRPFRRSLLVRAGRSAPATQVTPERMSGLHVAADVTPVARKGERLSFKDGRGRTIAPKHADAVRMLKKLADAYPATLPLEELAPPAKQQAARRALFTMLTRDQLSISTEALSLGRAADARPCVWRLARLEAAAGQPWATGLHHLPVKLPPSLAALVTLMDGSRDRAALLEAAERAPDGITPKQRLTSALAYCARNGLLEN